MILKRFIRYSWSQMINSCLKMKIKQLGIIIFTIIFSLNGFHFLYRNKEEQEIITFF
jgi:hypothetical protein